MRRLRVRGIPEDLYEALRAAAQVEGRFLSAQTVAMLKKALADQLVDRARGSADSRASKVGRRDDSQCQ